MLGSFQTGVSGLQQFQQDLEVIGNNIANVNTVGFKSSRMEFEDAFSQSLNNGSPSMQVGTGVNSSAIRAFFAQGTLNNTGHATDLAIVDRGFFVLRDANTGASFASRDGQFKLENGFLVNNGGLRLQGHVGAAPITPASPIGDIEISAAAAIASLGITSVPAPTLDAFNIDLQGRVNVRLSDTNGNTFTGVIAQVVLQDFANLHALSKEGGNLYSWGPDAGALAAPVAADTNGVGTIRAGALETSNVDLGNEMTLLITAQRAFQANAKIVTTSDEVLQDLVNLKR